MTRQVTKVCLTRLQMPTTVKNKMRVFKLFGYYKKL